MTQDGPMMRGCGAEDEELREALSAMCAEGSIWRDEEDLVGEEAMVCFALGEPS